MAAKKILAEFPAWACRRDDGTLVEAYDQKAAKLGAPGLFDDRANASLLGEPVLVVVTIKEATHA